MFWVRTRLGGREYLGVLDTGATISIVAKKILPCGSLKNTMTTAAIRMGDGHVVHSCGDCEVEVPMGSRTIANRFYVMDTEAFDFVLGTDFFVQHSQIQSLTLLMKLKWPQIFGVSLSLELGKDPAHHPAQFPLEGPDGVPPYLLAILPDNAFSVLHHCLSLCYEAGDIPHCWLVSESMCIFKGKGSW